MPKFLDHHPTMPEVTPEAAREMAGRIKAGKPDEHGVTGLNVFVCANGEGYCLSEAPDADAVVKAHASLGFPLRREDIVEVDTII
jgi:Protein of unknown function (DUF4242)